jgi:uncharacterized protein (TIGR02001 family)
MLAASSSHGSLPRYTVSSGSVALAIFAALAAPGCALLAPPVISSERESAATAGGAKVNSTVAAVSDYMFRGVSLSDRRPAIQGSVDLTLGSSPGLSANLGVWGSSVRFDSDTATPRNNAVTETISKQAVRREAGIYGGVGGGLVAGWRWGAQLSYYRYPGFGSLDWTERALSLSRDFPATSGRPAVEFLATKFRDVFSPGSDGDYLSATVKLALAGDFSIATQIGQTRFQDQLRGGKDYVDRSLTLSRPYAGFQIDLSYTCTNTEQYGALGHPTLLLAVSKTF